MTTIRRAACLTLPAIFLFARVAFAQDLVPGAYVPAPVGINVATILAAFSAGGLSFDPTLPVDNASARLGTAAVSYNRTFNLAGRFASIGVAVPYINGHAEGVVLGQPAERWLNGVADPAVRFAVNLHGARAMTPKEFASYRAGRIVGVSMTVQMPLGEYDNTRFLNLGRNRWTFRPEVAISTTKGHWTFETDIGVAFYTTNTDYVNGGTLAQKPIAAAQVHLIYTIRLGFWIAADVNFWHGGRLVTNGVAAAGQQSNSRAGITAAIPFLQRQIRVSYSFGAYTNIGTDFHTVGVSYSHAWK